SLYRNNLFITKSIRIWLGLQNYNTMKHVFLFLFFIGLILSSSTLFAQSNATGNIRGLVKDETGGPATYATVKLLKLSDSTLVKGALTNEKAAYSFEKIAFGDYFISISVLGKKKVFISSFSVNNENKKITLPVATVTPSSKSLKSVQVTATKPFIQHKPGQTIVNVENSSVSAGNTVLEVLKKSPGIYVDQDGNITMNGKSGVNVMINGRPTHLSAKQLSAVLKGMPAASVSSISLMRQPPAKYSAEGTAGLINIELKKQVALGLNGSLNAGIGYGQYLKYNTGGSINYKNKKFSIYSNYNFNHQKNKIGMNFIRDFYAPDSKDIQTTLTQESKLKNGRNNHTAQLV